MHNETPQERWASRLAFVTSVLPGMIAINIFPSWIVLPPSAWFAVALIGGGISGAIATPRFNRGIVSGFVLNSGMFGGIWFYPLLCTWITGHRPVRPYEAVFGACIGAIPGLILYCRWARPSFKNRLEPRLVPVFRDSQVEGR